MVISLPQAANSAPQSAIFQRTTENNQGTLRNKIVEAASRNPAVMNNIKINNPLLYDDLTKNSVATAVIIQPKPATQLVLEAILDALASTLIPGYTTAKKIEKLRELSRDPQRMATEEEIFEFINPMLLGQ